MKQIVCEMCGGKELIKRDSVYICQNCGTKYSVEEAKKMIVEVDNSNKLENDLKEVPKFTEQQYADLMSRQSSTDLKSKKSRDFSFLIKPLIHAPEDIGCGCIPAGCFSYITAPIFIIGFVVLMIISAIAPKNSSTSAPNSTSTSNIEDQKIEARVQLAQAIKANLREPKSYQNTAIEVWTLEEYIYVSNTFKGKNRFGGYEVCTFVARFNFNTKPAEWAITNNPKSDSGCREIMIALP